MLNIMKSIGIVVALLLLTPLVHAELSTDSYLVVKAEIDKPANHPDVDGIIERFGKPQYTFTDSHGLIVLTLLFTVPTKDLSRELCVAVYFRDGITEDEGKKAYLDMSLLKCEDEIAKHQDGRHPAMVVAHSLGFSF
jgi:hypothetical protein